MKYAWLPGYSGVPGLLKALNSEKKAYDVSDALAGGYMSTGGIETLK
jgi:hypothetical protein